VSRNSNVTETPSIRGARRKPRAPNRFMLSELTRAMRAAQKAEISIERYEVDPRTGRLILYPKQDGTSGDGEALDAATVAKSRIAQMKAGT
jgi:hypothetical protein